MGMKYNSTTGIAGSGNPLQFQQGTFSVAGLTGNQVLASANYENGVLVVSGAMAGDTSLEFPNTIGGTVQIVNQSTGGVLSVKATGGTAIPLTSGLSIISIAETIKVYTTKNQKSTIALADANTVLTWPQCQSDYIVFTGALSAGRDVTFPASALGLLWVKNSGTGFTLTLKVGAGTYALTNNSLKLVYITPTTIEVLN